MNNIIRDYFNYINKYAENVQIEMGKKVEQEHRGTIKKLIKELRPDLSEEEVMKYVLKTELGITIDHVEEFDKYYTALDKMENELRAQKTK